MGGLTSFALLALTVVGALNLILTLRLAARISPGAPRTAGPAYPTVGEPIAAFSGRRLIDGRRIVSEDLVGQHQVLLFVSAGCPVCFGIKKEIGGLLPALATAGVGLRVVAIGQPDTFEGSPLRDHALDMDEASRRLINPQQASPMYVFLDDALTVVASGIAGDEDWASFVDQMRELA